MLYNTGEDTNFCSQRQCMDARRKSIKNGEQFTCKHMEMVLKEMADHTVDESPHRFTSADLSYLENLPPDVRVKIEN